MIQLGISSHGQYAMRNMLFGSLWCLVPIWCPRICPKRSKKHSWRFPRVWMSYRLASIYLYLQDCGAFCGNSILFGISPDWILDAHQNLPWVNHWQKNAISIDWHRLTTIKARITIHQPEWSNNCALAQPENPSTILKIKQKFTKVDPKNDQETSVFQATPLWPAVIAGFPGWLRLERQEIIMRILHDVLP